MAKPKLKPEIKTETLVTAAPKWNVVVLNDPINYQAYVVVAFMNVLRISAAEAKKLSAPSTPKDARPCGLAIVNGPKCWHWNCSSWYHWRW